MEADRGHCCDADQTHRDMHCVPSRMGELGGKERIDEQDEGAVSFGFSRVLKIRRRSVESFALSPSPGSDRSTGRLGTDSRRDGSPAEIDGEGSEV
jgi:hypothetical protein